MPRPPRAVVERDKRIDALEAEVERQAVQIIALRAPMADDLREVVAALKIAGVVERIGDYAKNIAKRVPSIEDSKIRPLSLLPEMARIAGEMVHNVLDAFAARDADEGRRGVRARRRGRRFLQQHLPRPAHPHDGKSAQHHAGHPPAVRRQESRADRRPCHQRRRDGLFRRHRRASRRPRQGRRRAPTSEHRDLGDRKGTHPAGRGRPGARRAARLPFRARGIRRRASPRDGEEALLLARESAARRRHPRLDDRGPVRDRGLPPAAPRCPRPPTCRSSC